MSKGRETTVLKGLSASKESKVWSIVAQDRTLDLECEQEGEAARWAKALSTLFSIPNLLQELLMHLVQVGRFKP